MVAIDWLAANTKKGMANKGAGPAIWAYWPTNHLEVTSGVVEPVIASSVLPNSQDAALATPGGGHRADDVVLDVVQDVGGRLLGQL